MIEKKLNMNIQQHIDEIYARIRMVKKNKANTKQYVKLSNEKLREKIDQCAQAESTLLKIRQRRLKELMIYLFPIQHVLAAEE